MYRKLLLIMTMSVVGAAFGAGTASAQTETTFCNAALDVDRAVAALDEGKPKRAEVDRAEVALTALEATAPPDVAVNVDSIIATVRGALAEAENPAADPTFEQDERAINAYRFSSCGYQTAGVTLLEYEFDGLPKSFTTGTVAIKLTNTGTEVHELAIARLKTNDRLRKTLDLPEHQQGKRPRYLAQSLAAPDETSYLFVDFTRTGRYGAACHIPVGTSRLAQLGESEVHDEHGGSEDPHWKEGMLATFRVTPG